MKSSEKDHLIYVPGNNFSGRTLFLKSLGNNIHNKGHRPEYLYIGELTGNFITGLFADVKGEIDFHAAASSPVTQEEVDRLLDLYQFKKHYGKNPFKLSGGEQTILAILCALLMEPRVLAVDTCLEQLGSAWRTPLLQSIIAGKFPATQIYLADNRWNDYGIGGATHADENRIRDFRYDHSFGMGTGETPAEGSPAAPIVLKNVSFSYQKNAPGLEQVNISLEPGQIYHLAGENGAGKSTLAKIFTGLLKPGEGDIHVDGKPYRLFRYPGKWVGYSFQNPDEQLFSQTVEKEMQYQSGRNVGANERSEVFLRMFGLEQVRKSHPAELPFVMRKRLSLAATLANDRPWYILDEPTLGQDDDFISFLTNLLKEMARMGKGIIIISHSEKFVAEIRDKYLFLNNRAISSINPNL